MRCNGEGLSLLRKYEGLSLTPYLCPAGIFTIGFGSAHGVTKDTPPITRDEAEEMLHRDVEAVEKALNRMLTVPLNDNQYSALVCFAFNVGTAAFRASTLRAYVNRRAFDPTQPENAPDEFLRWVYAGKRKLEGLVQRRRAERALFIKPVVVKP